MDTTDITEFDCVEIGDNSVINFLCSPQTHLFEDRVMKIGKVRIGRGCQTGTQSVILYDAEVEDGVQIGPLTLIMKGERLPAFSGWIGSPAKRWNQRRMDASNSFCSVPIVDRQSNQEGGNPANSTNDGKSSLSSSSLTRDANITSLC